MIITASRRRSNDIWPGFVDALASILMVFIFMLLVFVLAQFFLSDMLAGRDKALDELAQRVNELADTLSLERDASAELRAEITDLTSRLRATLEERDGLRASLALTSRRAREAGGRAQASEDRVTELKALLEETQRMVSADKETIRLKLLEIASLQQDIYALREIREELEAKVGSVADTLKLRDNSLAEAREQSEALEQEVGSLRDRSKALATQLADERERTRLAQVDIDEKNIGIEELSLRIGEADRALVEERELSKQAQSQVALLNQQIESLRRQISQLSAALQLSETTVDEQKVKLDELGQKLNLALAQRVQELSRYRSDFFGRLREVLGNHPDISVVGDRFLFQSELLFASGSADIGAAGKQQLEKLADTLKSVSEDIPEDIDWILRIDGHTDARPIRTRRYPSNWELSTARAVSIVNYLVAQGIPAQRLAATGFAEFRPIDDRKTLQANARNRRIELKLTGP
ncbi:MAG: peptidoglycan -binding protein [Gammaproteobacteria bacterium]